PLAEWTHIFAFPSVAAILATYVALRWTQRRSLDADAAGAAEILSLRIGGKLAATGIALTAGVLLAASALDRQLGVPTFVAGALVTMAVLIASRQSPIPILKDVSWSVLPLVAGLFILVEGIDRTGALRLL